VFDYVVVKKLGFGKTREEEQSIIEHLEEMRKVLIVSIVATIVAAIGCWFVADDVLAVFLNPVTSLGHDIIFIGITEALMTKLKLSLFLGFLVALPIILWQVWSFVLPALRKEEKRFFTLFVIISLFTFLIGISFAFFGIYGLGVAFLLRFAGPELVPMLTIGNYIGFTITFMIPFGLVFQLPLAVYCLSKMGVVSHNFLTRSRKYALLVIVLISSMLTPADILTCVLMATPMYTLYELSVWIARLVERGKARKARAEAAAESA
jgi:sec-independent protein translocase protein TatC